MIKNLLKSKYFFAKSEKIKRRFSAEMPPKKVNTTVEMTLYEKPDMDVLKRLISCSELDEIVCNQLDKYYAKRNVKGCIPVSYSYSKNLLDSGRLYANGGLSLQSFKKEIRHALAKDTYIDVDINNCHPTLLLQYCQRQNPPILCPKLEYYVGNREEFLSEVMEKHAIDRGTAKELVLSFLFLGGYVIDGKKPADFSKNAQELKAECKRISKNISNIEKDITELVKSDPTKTNKPGSVTSILLTRLEDKCLMAIYDFFTKKNIKVGVLVFDGLMIEKAGIDDIESILIECEGYVKLNVRYEITLSNKPMDIPLSFDLPEIFPFVESDLEAQVQLFKLEGKNKFKFCDEELYIFDERTGMFKTNPESLFYYLIKNKDFLRKHTGKTILGDSVSKIVSYGENSKLQRDVMQFVKTAAVDDDWLSMTENTSLGYLLFKNGIYNMKTGTFKEGFDSNIVFHAQVPWEFPAEVSQSDVDYAMNLSFNAIFEDPKLMILCIARAIAGDITFKKFFFCTGNSNAGKSKLILMLQHAFGGYVGTFNAEALTYNEHDSGDEGQKNRWGLLLRFCRILCSNEVNMQKEFNANEIKKHSSGGDKLVGRGHYKNEIPFTPHYTIFCMANDLPKIKPLDDAAFKRIEWIKFPYVFDDKLTVDNPMVKLKDPQLEDKIKEDRFIRAFIRIILDGYKTFLKEGMPQFDLVTKEEWTCDDRPTDIVMDAIRENFTITLLKEDTITISEMTNFRNKNPQVFKTISTTKFNEILKNNGLIADRSKNCRFWRGVKWSNPTYFSSKQ